MDLNMKGKIAVVTGAGSEIGFGRQVCLTLAEEGAVIVASDINVAGAEKTIALVKAKGSDGVAVRCDVTNRDDVKQFVQTVIDQYGRIDILINCAGGCSPAKTFVEQTEKDWDFDIKLNLYSQMYMQHEILPHMINAKYGRIVNFCGGRGLPLMATYGAAKGGVEHITHTIAAEVAKYGIFVNCIVPGLSKTHFVDTMNQGFIDNVEKSLYQGRLCNAVDVANLTVFMASDKNSYMNGGVIRIQY
jgi:NAD(P)-dependent dehydrogenase (short-subunit alcohol dehydrogenase family)